jgi:hypothetical protein
MIISFQSLTSINGIPVDPQTLLIYWGPFQAGDEGAPISVYAYPHFSWQFTGYPAGGHLSNPCVPIPPDRLVTVYASNDKDCWGPIFTMNANPVGMVNRNGDPMRSGYPDGNFFFVKPKVGGSFNQYGPDCGLLLFCARQFGPRV